MTEIIDTPKRTKSAKSKKKESAIKHESNITESPKEKPQLKADAPIAVVLFAGGGGVDCGMIEAGIRPVVAVELDPEREELSNKIADCHEKNFAEYGCVTLRKTVQDKDTIRGILEVVGEKKVDFVHASPSCKNVSNAKKGKGEKGADMVAAEAIAEVIRRIQPKVFTLEEVPGYKDTNAFQMICAQLRTCGYLVEWEVVNLADYGVPQSRQRLILRAGKEEMLPLPQICDRVGWYEAIADLIPGMEDSELLPGQKEAIKEFFEGEVNQPLLIGRTGRSADRIRTRNQGIFTLTTAIFTDQNENNRNRFADIVLPDGAVKSVSIEAVARLQSFPSWYEFTGECGVDGTIIGNSVPPLFASKLFSQKPIPIKKAGAIICCDIRDFANYVELCDRRKLEPNHISPSEFEEMGLVEKKELIKEILHKYPADSAIVVVGDRDFHHEFFTWEGIYQFEYLEIGAETASDPEIPEAQEKNDTDIFAEGGKTFIRIEAINLDISTQSRVEISVATVEEYKQLREDGVEFPPVLVFRSEEGNFLVDGWHRVLAEKSMGGEWIYAELRNGTRREALLHSCGVNASHGLRRTSADKRKAVTTLLKDEEWAKWSNREIASRCGCDEGTVRRIRKELSAEIPHVVQSEIKFERNGKTQTTKVRANDPTYKPKMLDEVRVTGGRFEGRTGEIRGFQGNNCLVWLHGNHLNSREQIGIGELEPIQKQQPLAPTTIKEEQKQQAADLGLKNKPQLLPDIPRNEGFEPEESLPASYTGINKLNLEIALSQLSPQELAEILSKLPQAGVPAFGVGEMVGFAKPKSANQKDFSKQIGCVTAIAYVVEVDGKQIMFQSDELQPLQVEAAA